MTITRQTLATNIRTAPINTSTNNKYVRAQNGAPYLEFSSVSNLLKGMQTPMVDGQSGVQRWLKDRSRGFGRISKLINYSQEVSEEKLEQFIYDTISIYLFNGEVGKFPVENNKEVGTPETSEDPDDMPPIDKGLDDIGISKDDFKL